MSIVQLQKQAPRLVGTSSPKVYRQMNVNNFFGRHHRKVMISYRVRRAKVMTKVTLDDTT